MKLDRIIFSLWQLLPTLLLLSATMLTDGNPQQRSASKETGVRHRRRSFPDNFVPTRIRKKRQLFDGFNFQFMDSLTRAMEGLDTMLRSTQNFDVFNCLQRISCEITAPLSNDESGRQLRREFFEEDPEVVKASPKVASEEVVPKEQTTSPMVSNSILPSVPYPYQFGHIPIHPASLPYYYPWIYGVHPYHFYAENLKAFNNYSVHNPALLHDSLSANALPSYHFPYHPQLIRTATPHLVGGKALQHLPHIPTNEIDDLEGHSTDIVVNTENAKPHPTLINPRNGVNNQNLSQGKMVAVPQNQESKFLYQNRDDGTVYQNYDRAVYYKNQGHEPSYQNRGSETNHQNPGNWADYQNQGNRANHQDQGYWANYQNPGTVGDSPTPIQRIGYESEEEESTSWFSGYRNAIKSLKNKIRFGRRNQRQDDGNWFKRLFGRRRRRRSITDFPPTVEEFKSRVRRGIKETLSKAADSGKQFMGALERMMQGASSSSIYPLTQAALMGYVGNPKTCQTMYPKCPTSSDEMIQTFNNLNKYFPNGIPFRDRIPRPLRFFIP